MGERDAGKLERERERFSLHFRDEDKDSAGERQWELNIS